MTNGTAIVVGASLSGLMTAIALAKENIHVIILEKVSDEQRTGSGLRVNGARFSDRRTEKLLENLASGGRSSIQLWSSIETRLRAEAQADNRIDLRYNTRVQDIHQDETSAWITTDKEEIISGDILIGADGHNSNVRKYVAPEQPNATFAGYIGWLASTSEMDLPMELRPSDNHPELTMLDSTNGFIFGSLIDPQGNAEGEGNRRIGCTWYDNSRNDVFRQTGCIEGTVVQHSLTGPNIPEQTIKELKNEVTRKWSEPWASAMHHALDTRNITGIPIKEYAPNTLVNGRIALVGDAAHVPAPITASGFNESLQDAAILGECVAKGIRGNLALKALQTYEALRLNTVRRMVQSGQSYSRSFGR